jgi:hypothetical protein
VLLIVIDPEAAFTGMDCIEKRLKTRVEITEASFNFTAKYFINNKNQFYIKNQK